METYTQAPKINQSIKITSIKESNEYKLLSFCIVTNLKQHKPFHSNTTLADYHLKYNKLTVFNGQEKEEHYVSCFKEALLLIKFNFDKKAMVKFLKPLCKECDARGEMYWHGSYYPCIHTSVLKNK